MSENKIILYHGTYHIFDKIDVAKGQPFKDFGQGFYASKVRKQASNLAKRNAIAEKERLIQAGNEPNANPFVYSYYFDENNLANFDVKIFEEADLEWLDFILYNRTHETPLHKYDVVVGPAANDDTMPSINLYLRGALGTIGEIETKNILLRMIEPMNLPHQFFIGSQKATDLIEFIERTDA